MTAFPCARVGRPLCTAALLALSLGASAAEPLNVYVSILPLKSFVERVGGADGNPDRRAVRECLDGADRVGEADRVRDALTELAPARAAPFADGYRRFAADLDALDAQIRAELAGRKERTFLAFHPSWGHFARAYSLTQLAIEAEGKEPGPRALATVIDEARRRGTRIVFVQKQFSRNDAKAVASAIGGEVVVIDPLAEDFLANTRTVAEAFARNLR